MPPMLRLCVFNIFMENKTTLKTMLVLHKNARHLSSTVNVFLMGRLIRTKFYKLYDCRLKILGD